MAGTPIQSLWSQRIVIKEELAQENYTCTPLPEDNYDSTITTPAEYWISSNIENSPSPTLIARELAGLASSNYSALNVDEGIYAIHNTAPYPFEMRGFVHDRPVTTGSLELPKCSELYYVSTFDTGTYLMSYITYDTTVNGTVICAGVPNRFTLRCGTSAWNGLADIVNQYPTFSHRIVLLNDCGCTGGGGNDTDGDGIPDEDDSDMDGDGIGNDHDNDTDGDGIPNDQDPDDDNDGIPDGDDDSPSGPDEPDDIDGDGIPNDEDDDIDGDGVLNEDDDDMDGDGVNNDEDLDDDADGVTDWAEIIRWIRDLINNFRNFIDQLA